MSIHGESSSEAHMHMHHHDMGGLHHDAMGTAESGSFCSGEMGMVMIMEGFQWALKEESSCINLFLASWTLNTRFKFIIGMLGVVLLGVATEGISRLRHDLSNKARGSNQDEHFKFTLMQTGLHGLHAFTGYMLMLATMTFAWEMMLSVVIGLTIGYYYFGGPNFNTSTNPCCAFLEDEADAPLLEPLLARNDVLPTSTPEQTCCNMPVEETVEEGASSAETRNL